MLAPQPVRILYFREEEREERGLLTGKVRWEGKKNNLKYSITFLDIVIIITESLLIRNMFLT